MLRWTFLILASAACLAAQIRWTCDRKDGKFITTLCANCEKFYCWDGEVFSNEEGYTPPPSYVLAYWEEVHRKSQQLRADIERRGKELKEQVEKGKEETARLNEERKQAHQEYMDDLRRRMRESQAPHSPQRPAMATNNPRFSPGGMTSSNQRAVPKDVVLTGAEPEPSGPGLPAVSRAKASEIQVGMDRAAVEKILGKPHSAISIPEDDGLVEMLSYTLDDHATARVRVEKGKVASVQIPQ